MKEAKHKQLMTAARRVPALEAPAGFDAGVLRAIRDDLPNPVASAASMMEQLAALFPRLAAAALLVIVAAAAFEYFAGGDVAAQLAEASDQWLLPLDWL